MQRNSQAMKMIQEKWSMGIVMDTGYGVNMGKTERQSRDRDREQGRGNSDTKRKRSPSKGEWEAAPKIQTDIKKWGPPNRSIPTCLLISEGLGREWLSDSRKRWRNASDESVIGDDVVQGAQGTRRHRRKERNHSETCLGVDVGCRERGTVARNEVGQLKKWNHVMGGMVHWRKYQCMNLKIFMQQESGDRIADTPLMRWKFYPQG